jgi:hypothetical protein
LSRLVFAARRHDHDRGAAVELINHYIHAVARLDSDRFADDVGMDWKLTTSAVDKDSQRYTRGPSEIGQFVESRSNSSASVENVVDDHDVHAFDSPRQARWANHWSRANRLEVVAVERNVQRALWNFDAFALFDEGNEPAGELHASPLNPHNNQIGRAFVQLDDLIGHSLQGPVDHSRGEDRFLFSCPSWH